MLYFIRHGQSEANVQGVFAGGKIDSPLTPKGIEQARDAAQKILESGIIFDRIISSPQQRALHTAQTIKDTVDFVGDIEVDDRLVEYDFGILTNKPYPVDAPEDILVSAAEVEGWQSLYNRTNDFYGAHKESTENILVSGHGLVQGMVVAIVEGYDPKMFYLYRPERNAELWKAE